MLTRTSGPQGGRMSMQHFSDLCDYLAGVDGCNFREDGDGATWDCDRTLTKTAQWLRERRLPVEENLTALRDLGGHCDCEVLFNVHGHWPVSDS